MQTQNKETHSFAALGLAETNTIRMIKIKLSIWHKRIDRNKKKHLYCTEEKAILKLLWCA